MKISEIKQEVLGDQAEVSALIDDYRVFYRIPATQNVRASADPFVVAALIPAMKNGKSIEVPEHFEISTRLLKHLKIVQQIFKKWVPGLTIIEIACKDSACPESNASVGSFFSGGVDGLHTFLRHREEITDLICVHGIDINLDNKELFDRVMAVNLKIANHYGKRLIPVISNVRDFGYRNNVSWTALCGAGLASIALLLNYRKSYIASSHTYAELFPWGSHPLIDPLFSTESIEIVHDGAEASRTEKVREISESDIALSNLRVCWQSGEYNCCKCDKCLRTLMSLRVLGVPATSFPGPLDIRQIKKIKVWDDNELSFLEDNAKMASDAGDLELLNAIRVPIKKYRFKKTMRDFDRDALNGLGAKLRSFFRSKPAESSRLKF